MILQLSLYAVISSLSSPGNLIPVVAAVVVGITVDYLHNYLRYDDDSFPDGAVVTALIVSGIVFPSRLVPAVTATILALFFKHLFKLSRRNIFNPAASGLYAVSVLFGTGLTWWISGSIWVFLLGLPIAYLVRLETSSITFLLTYWALNIAFVPGFLSGNPFTILTAHTVFFALIMVLEPMSTPNTRKGQALFGIGVALLAFLLGTALSHPLLTDNFLVSLLVMNLFHRILSESGFEWMK